MKKLILKSMAFAMLTMVIFSSCKKDKSDSPAITKENIAGTYKLIALTVNGQSYYEFLDPCEKDDDYKLNLDLTMEYVDAGTVCSPAGGYSSTWSLLGTNSIIIDSDTGTIDKFDGHVLKVTGVQSGVTYSPTYSKQ